MERDKQTPIEQEPQVSRLKMPKHYEQADGKANLLTWSNVVKKLEQAQNYWLATVSPKQQPHVTPIWGVWVAGAFYFDGIPTAYWARNLAANPAIAIHLESGVDVVIVEGLAEDVVTDTTVGKDNYRSLAFKVWPSPPGTRQ